MPPISSSSRLRCTRCLRPLATEAGGSACLCGLVRPAEHQVEVQILQHPLEQLQAKGTARLAHLCLPGSVLRVGEVHERPANPRNLYELLLYPETAPGQGLATPIPLDEARLQPANGLRLIVIDGTWRKSLKMLHLNPWLQALPRLRLQATPPSQYRIRRAHAEHQLSTLEAIALALQQLEGGEPSPLWNVLRQFVARQEALASER
ncbi:tRNA-uridine aminocarboxypropyltransferase [Roseateles toxinivorans]|uniref:tRNA-uridine aminocarboxypropyltransferase n=1 Tax=Roseateles toxinivorans TaxID=270368 RepID=A0A4R6QTC2_9BURK|nr:tRNA-uridine aminocarboxypropyltransferase [Roseateles toxinivorans]TDP74910.1 DTW domain-containing protein YfiP [Roseateles toxinivorans]